MRLNTYLSLCSEYYELDKPTAPKDALDFYMHFAKKANGPILEPMCGTGRFLLPILQKGYDVEGFDASSNMLSILRKKAVKNGLTPRVWEQFIEDINVSKAYNLIIIPSSSFSLIIDEEKIGNSLNVIYQQLNPGGKFVFEAESAGLEPKPSNIWKGDIKHINEDAYIIFSSFHLPIANNIETIICKYELAEFGNVTRTEIEELKVKKYFPDELLEKIYSAGFSKIITHKAYSRGKKPCQSDEEIVYECIK